MPSKPTTSSQTSRFAWSPEQESFVEYHRKLIEEWRVECPHKVWRLNKARFDRVGSLEYLGKKYLPKSKIEVESGEFVVALFKQGDGGFSIPLPPEIPSHLIGKLDPDLLVTEGDISKDSSRFLAAKLKTLRTLGKVRSITLKNEKSGKKNDFLLSNPKGLKDLPEYEAGEFPDYIEKISGKGVILNRSTPKKAIEAMRASRFLQKALDYLESLEGKDQTELARFFEMVFHAGKLSFKAEQSDSLRSDAAFELTDQTNKGQPRLIWKKAAKDFLQTHGLKKKWWEVLEYLKEQNLAYWEGHHGGECDVRDAAKITFEDGKTKDKNRQQFQDSIQEVRKNLRKNPG